MSTRTARRPGTSAPTDGSRTITVEDNQPREEDAGGDSPTVGTLRLRGVPRRRQRVMWREDVVDNEGAGKKKSKICCIYHRPKQFDESSSSDESSESDSESDSNDRPRRRCDHDHDHDHGDHEGHDDGAHTHRSRESGGGGVIHELESDSDDVNAYERAPRRKPKKGKDVARAGS